MSRFVHQVRFEDEVDQLSVVFVVDIGEVGIMQLPIIDLIVSIGVPVPEFDIEATPGVDNSSYSQDQEETDGCYH